MKRLVYLLILAIVLVSFESKAAYNTPSGTNVTFPITIVEGGTNATTAQGALNNFYATPVNANSGPILSPCLGFSDEQRLGSSSASASSAKTFVQISNGCVVDNRITLPSGGGVTWNGFWGGPVGDPSGAFGQASSINFFSFGGSVTNGMTFINMNGARQFAINSVNFGSDSAFTPAAMISSSSTSGGDEPNLLDFINSSATQFQTIVGCVVDGGGACMKNGGITGGTIVGGTGYVNGNYTGVPLTGGSGTGAQASVTVAGNAITSVTINTPFPSYKSGIAGGQNYVVGDITSAANSNLGGSGSGFTYTISNIATASFSTTDILVRAIKNQFSDFGVAIALNFSDLQVYATEFSCCGIGIEAIGGSEGNQIANNRFEFLNNAIVLGGPNGGSNGATFINSNVFTHSDGGPDVVLGQGDGYTLNGNIFQGTIGQSSLILGGTNGLTDTLVSGDVWAQPQNSTVQYCADLQPGFAMDYIYIGPIICYGNSNTAIKAVHYGQVPAHFVEDSIGVGGEHAEMGRPFAIGTSAPLGTTQAALEIDGTTSIVMPVGNTSQRPTPVEGMIRDNTTTHAVESYVNGSWTSFSNFTAPNLFPYLQGAKNGLTLSNDLTTPNSILDIAQGIRESDDNTITMVLGAPITKTTGIWVVGSGNGALDTGTITTNTWYHVFLIERLDTGVVDVLFSASSWMPVTPAGYGVKGWIGAFKTDGSSHILPFTQDGSTFYEASVLDANAVSIGTTSALQTLGGVPSGVKVNPLIRPTKSLDTTAVLITSPDQPDEVPTGTYPTTSGAGATLIGISTTAQGVIPTVSPAGLKTNSSGQVRVRANATGSTFSIVTYGWIADFGAQISGQIFLTSASSSPLILPNNWNVSTNAIDAIGEGGGGAQFANGGGGGAGGCFSRLVNLSDSVGTSEAFQIGAGGTATTTQFKNGSTLVAGFGPSATGQTGATGCATSTSTGSLKHAGGSGGTVSGSIAGGGGGGGGGGLIGAGANGAADLGSAFGAGGGGADGGSAGSTVTGGNNFGAFGGGATGGNSGIFGGGGGGSATAPPATAGGIGGTGTEYSSLFGSGGGGGGGNGSSFAGCGVGGAGGGYGGGGGGGGTIFGSGTGCAGGAASGGLIVLRWLLP